MDYIGKYEPSLLLKVRMAVENEKANGLKNVSNNIRQGKITNKFVKKL